MSNKSKNRISPANIIAVIAIAALGVLTFFGSLFLSKDGNIGNAAITAAIFTFSIGLLLIFCIATKRTESEFKKWRVVELLCLAAYFAVAAYFYKPTLQFFHVLQNKEKLQKQAVSEIDAIENMCDKYNKDARYEVNTAYDNLESYFNSGKNSSADDGGLRDYMDERKMEDLKGCDEWRDDALDVTRFKTESLDSLRQRVETWSFMDLSAIAFEMDTKAADTWDALDSHIKEMKEKHGYVPEIVQNPDDNTYRLDGYVKFDIGEKPGSSQFKKDFKEPVSGFNLGIIAYIVLHLLALMNYFLVRRSPIIDIKKGNQSDDSGLPLKIQV